MMILWVLAGSVAGISAMVAVNAWLGLSQPARLDSLDEAVKRLDEDAVGFEAGEAILAREGRGALVEERGTGRVGLLAPRGADFVIRYIAPGEVREVRTDEEARLTVRLADFTLAPVVLVMESGREARAWADRLNALRG